MTDRTFHSADDPTRENIFLWQYSIEHHTYFTCLSLQKLSNQSAAFLLGFLENEVRKGQGWDSIDLSPLNIRLLSPSRLQRDGRKIIRENKTSVHVFNGFRGAPGYNYFPLILYALQNNVKTVILNEPFSRNPTGYFTDENPLTGLVKVITRPILYRCLALSIRAASKNLAPCIMPISLIARQQFMALGFPQESLFPFGYFVPKQAAAQRPARQSTAFRIVFVGAMLKRKGLDVLRKAFTEVRKMGFAVTLDIYGSGDYQAFEAQELDIYYRGRKPIFAMQSVIGDYDVLVLPSRHDGWGTVVNEALLQGVPVIASDRVGAKCLLENGDCGLVFRSEDPSDLAKKIVMLIADRKLRARLKRNAGEIGGEISPQRAARYFLDVIDFHFYRAGGRPRAVWSDNYQQDRKHKPILPWMYEQGQPNVK
jgi:glycosyltransferase involved in cell wall biosynthesis